MDETVYRITTRNDKFLCKEYALRNNLKREKTGIVVRQYGSKEWQPVTLLERKYGLFEFFIFKPFDFLFSPLDSLMTNGPNTLRILLLILLGIPFAGIAMCIFLPLAICDEILPNIYATISDSETDKLLEKYTESSCLDNYSGRDCARTKIHHSATVRDDRRISRCVPCEDNHPMQNFKETYKEHLHKEMIEIADRHPELDIKTDDDWKPVMELAKIQIWKNPETMKTILSISDEQLEEIYDNNQIKEEKKLANHSAFEGRISSSDKRKLKSSLGFTCQACGKNMEDIYGAIGKNYIELHHKVPYSDMKENDTRLLSQDDFCVLCPNCHRMIHKLEDAGDIELLKRIIKLNNSSQKNN